MTIGNKIITLYRQVHNEFGREYDENTMHFNKGKTYPASKVVFVSNSNGESAMAGVTTTLTCEVPISVHDIHIGDKVEYEGHTLYVNTAQESKPRVTVLTCKGS